MTNDAEDDTERTLSVVNDGDDQEGGFSGRSMLGTLCLYGSAGILFLGVIDTSSSLTFMPPSWYSNRTAWYLGAGIGFIASILLLKSRRPVETRSSAPQPKTFERVVLYTREGCHLCDDARDLLAKFQSALPEIEEVDIDADPELQEKFTDCVPVVEIDGKVRFRGKVNEVLLQRLIDAAGDSDDVVERSA